MLPPPGSGAEFPLSVPSKEQLYCGETWKHHLNQVVKFNITVRSHADMSCAPDRV